MTPCCTQSSSPACAIPDGPGSAHAAELRVVCAVQLTKSNRTAQVDLAGRTVLLPTPPSGKTPAGRRGGARDPRGWSQACQCVSPAPRA